MLSVICSLSPTPICPPPLAAEVTASRRGECRGVSPHPVTAAPARWTAVHQDSSPPDAKQPRSKSRLGGGSPVFFRPPATYARLYTYTEKERRREREEARKTFPLKQSSNTASPGLQLSLSVAEFNRQRSIAHAPCGGHVSRAEAGWRRRPRPVWWRVSVP